MSPGVCAYSPICILTPTTYAGEEAMGKDYYEVLGVSKDADEDQLKKGAGRTRRCSCITSSVCI